jgi:hypothetical protein
MKDQRRHKLRRIPYLFLAIALVAFGCTRRAELGQQIVFASKAFYDSAQTTGEGHVYIAGTLSGEGVAYKNNTVAVTCYKDRMECLTYSVAQIGPNQVGRLDSPASYPVTKWDAYEIVATDSEASMNCRKVTISIVRKSQTAVWVEEPINQSSAACKDAETRVLKWTIEEPGWKALHTNNK